MNLLDPPPFIVDDDHVVEADRLGKGHLHARDQVLERGLRGGTDDQPCDTRRGHQRDADGADAGDAEQHQADGQEHDQEDADPPQYLRPRPLSPGAEIVLDADIGAQIDHALKRAQRGYRQPAEQGGHTETQGLPPDFAPIARHRNEAHREADRDGDRDPAQGLADMGKDQIVALAGRPPRGMPCDPHRDAVYQHGDEDRDRNDRQVLKPQPFGRYVERSKPAHGGLKGGRGEGSLWGRDSLGLRLRSGRTAFGTSPVPNLRSA